MMMMDLVVSWMTMSVMSMMGVVTVVGSDELEEGFQRDMSIMSMMIEDLLEMELLC